jgi:predicted nucleotidyltransferase
VVVDLLVKGSEGRGVARVGRAREDALEQTFVLLIDLRAPTG